MQQLDLILQAINQNLNPVKIILFGSRAKGTAKKGSDWDIAVIQKEKPKLQQKADVIATLMEMDYDWKVKPDIHLFSQEVFNYRLKEDDLFVSEIAKGKVIYG